MQLADEIAAWEQFLPTPSVRRATKARPRVEIEIIISTHALREEGDRADVRDGMMAQLISTHALREEGDTPRARRRYVVHYNFYPRPP